MLPAPLGRLTASLWLLLAGVATAASPLLAALAGVAAMITRRRQPLLLVRFALIYLWREAAVIMACAGLWLISGAGARLGSRRFQLAHYSLLRWFLRGFIDPAMRLLDLRLDVEPSPTAQRALHDSDRPLLVFSRHAGPGDSILLIYLLLARFGRLPRMVMKRQIALDPVVGLICRRLPNAPLDLSDQQACEAQIAELARGLDGRGVLLLFPEGGNFTERRRVRALDRLRREAPRRQAAAAQQMRHMLPPKPGGALAALQAAPDLDVIFAAHTGLGREVFPAELWRRLPFGQTLHMRLWLSPADTRPADPDGQIRWLYEWWQRLDDWIEAQHKE